MPFSLSTGKDQIQKWFTTNQHKLYRILDVGVGSGTYCKLIKEDNKVCVNSDWVGIEAWGPYIEQFDLKNRYNTIINTDIRKIDWETLGKFDVAIAGDVLEHVTKEDAIFIVDKILDYSSVLIISIPIVHMPQDEYEGNPYEVHIKDNWSHDEVLDTWNSYIKDFYIKSKKSKIGVYWLSK